MGDRGGVSALSAKAIGVALAPRVRFAFYSER